MHLEYTATRPKSGRAARVRASLWRALPAAEMLRAEYFATLTWPGGFFETHVVGEKGTRVQVWKQGRRRDLTPDRARQASGVWYSEGAVSSMDDWARVVGDHVRQRIEGEVEI